MTIVRVKWLLFDPFVYFCMSYLLLVKVILLWNLFTEMPKIMTVFIKLSFLNYFDSIHFYFWFADYLQRSRFQWNFNPSSVHNVCYLEISLQNEEGDQKGPSRLTIFNLYFGYHWNSRNIHTRTFDSIWRFVVICSDYFFLESCTFLREVNGERNWYKCCEEMFIVVLYIKLHLQLPLMPTSSPSRCKVNYM